MAVGRADSSGRIEPRATMSLDDNDPTMDENDPTKRSERKRQREKQRRFDLTAAFDELGSFMAQVDPEGGDGDLDGKKKRKRSGEAEDPGGATRLDLIGRALKVMKRLHAENEERKAIIATMRERGGAGMAGPNDNVMVLVPTLTPVDDGYVSVARASYPSYSHGYYQNQHGTTMAPHHVPPPPPPEYAMLIPQGRPPQQYQHGSWEQPRYGAPPPQHHLSGGRQSVQHDGSPDAGMTAPGHDPRSHSIDRRGV